MTSADAHALIEEARRKIDHGDEHPCTAEECRLTRRLADALEVSEAELVRLRSVVAGVNAYACDLVYTLSLAQWPKQIARRLRSVLSDTTGGTS